MNYNNHPSRAQRTRRDEPETILTVETDKRGAHLRLRKIATLARRKLSVAHLGALALLLSTSASFAAFLSDPFTSDATHLDESWAGSPAFSGKAYSDATIGGTNRPQTVTGAGVTLPTNANLGVTAASDGGQNSFITSGGNIYNPVGTLTLTLSTGASVPSNAFKTAIFQVRTLGNPLDTANVRMTIGATVIPPLYVVTSPGSPGSTDYGFQFDLSSVSGVAAFTIALPGAGSSVSYSYAQLDASSRTVGATQLVPEPSIPVALAAGAGLLSVATLRRRRLA